MKDCNCDLREGDAKTSVFGSNEMLQPAPVDTIPMNPTTPQIAYQMVKDETFAQTQPRLNLATFVTTYMDDYATKLMNEAISINYIDETEYPRIAVMNAKCINIMANCGIHLTGKNGKRSTGYRPSEACMLGGEPPGYAGKTDVKLRGNRLTSLTLSFQAVFRLFGKSSPNCGRLKCAKYLSPWTKPLWTPKKH